MPGTFYNDDQITLIVDSKVQPPSQAIPPPQSSTSSSLSESTTPESVHRPLNDPDISATLSQISDNQDTLWCTHGETFPVTLCQLSTERQLLGEIASSQAPTSSSTPTQTRRSQRERKKAEFYGYGKGLIAYNQVKCFGA